MKLPERELGEFHFKLLRQGRFQSYVLISAERSIKTIENRVVGFHSAHSFDGGNEPPYVSTLVRHVQTVAALV